MPDQTEEQDRWWAEERERAIRSAWKDARLKFRRQVTRGDRVTYSLAMPPRGLTVAAPENPFDPVTTEQIIFHLKHDHTEKGLTFWIEGGGITVEGPYPVLPDRPPAPEPYDLNALPPLPPGVLGGPA